MELNGNLHKVLYLLRQNPFNRIKFFAILVALILGLTTKSYSKNFYLSSSAGNDSFTALQAQNPATPWKTIDKLNNSMSLIDPGDYIFFKRGDVFPGQITLKRSGTASAMITFSAYGSGNLPIIKGTLPVTGWTKYSGNIWQSGCPQLASTVTNFFINEKSQQIGRYPNLDAVNKGYLLIKSHSSNTQLTGTSLTSSPNWTGAEAVVRSARWVLDKVPIQSHLGDVLIFSKPTKYDIKDNYGFFIQNHLNTLDQQGEWYFDSGNKKMYLYSSVDPNTLKTEAAAFSSTFTTTNQRYFSIDNLEFKGSLKTNINILNSFYIGMNNNIFSESGENAVFFVDCHDVNFGNNKIINSNSNALEFFNCRNIIAGKNEIQNTALREGMGLGYTAVNMYYQIRNCLFENNIIDRVGYNGICFGGDSITIRNNVISNFCMTLDDGAGLYTSGVEGNILNNNRELINNLIITGVGAGEGTDSPTYTAAEGIYIDDRTNNVMIINNTIANSSRGIFIHNSNKITIIGNTLYNNKTQLLFVHDRIATTYPITNCIVKDNILFSRLKSQTVSDFRTIDNGIPSFGTFDNNYYCRPIDDDATIYAEYTGILGTISKFMNLTTWQSTFNYDLNSKKSPYPILAYKITELIGTSKFGNANFNNDIAGWSSWSNYNNGNATWDNTNKIDGGSLKLSFSAASSKPDGLLIAHGNCGEVAASETYILKFSLIASSPGKLLKISIREDSSPYNYLTPMQYVSAGNAPKEFELLFTPESNYINARIDFEINEDAGQLWIDNVELYKANIQATNIDDSVKFIYNSFMTNKAFPIEGNFIDVKGTKYSGSVTLLPCSSAILIVDPNQSAPSATPVYVSSAIENTTPSRLEMTYSLPLANILPATSAFTVTVNSAVRTISSVSISGTKVLLTLASPIAYGNVITVAYTKPSTNPLQTTAGGQAATISEQTVTNKVNAPAVPIYSGAAIENATPTLVEITYSLNLANIVPSASAFIVNVNSAARAINSVAISGTKVSLTLASPVTYGNLVTVAYSAPSSNPLQTSAGGKATSITAQSVTNRVNPPANPVYVSSSVENIAPSVIEMIYNLTLANIVPSTSAFSVQVNSAARSVNSVSVSGTKVSLTLSSPVASGNVITIAYTAPSSNPLQTSAGGKATSITAQSVTNRVIPPLASPVYVSSSVENAAPSVIEVIYNLALANIVPATSVFSVQVNSAAISVNSVSVSGTKVSLTLSSPVASGNVITVAYTAPSSNPLQTSAGGKASSMTAQSVTNRVNPPANPVYVSSSVENAAPSVIEMIYNLALANIVPATSAFSVQVNSAAISVNSVSVSGTKVSLTLSSPVASGNVITIAYIAPSSNPLQTSAGGKATSITAQSVTNRVNPPANPVYVSSSVENAAPSVIELIYNLTLANIVPATSAFSVQVNSAVRTVNSVSISGTKVSLTLSSPVASGNVITIAYTAPLSNPLQTPAGGKAASINAQTVSNHVNTVSTTPPGAVNVPPVVLVNYNSSNNAGFVIELNARGSYDSNNDNLNFTWKVPDNIPVSGTNSSVLQFLAPVSDVSLKYEFTLTVSDGKTSQSKTISVKIIPYQLEMEAAEVKSVEASGFQYPYLPSNVLDGDIGSMWSASGNDQWIVLELKESFSIQHIKIAFQPGQKKEFYFDILGSVDKEVWESILLKSNSCAFSGNLQVFEIPTAKSRKEYNYIKFLGQGNSTDNWNYISEIKIFGYRNNQSSEYEEQMVKVYPNPAHELVNIFIEEQTFIPDFIKIVSLAGKVLFSDKIDSGVRQFEIPISFMNGIYIIHMGIGDITMFTQKLIIIK